MNPHEGARQVHFERDAIEVPSNTQWRQYEPGQAIVSLHIGDATVTCTEWNADHAALYALQAFVGRVA